MNKEKFDEMLEKNYSEDEIIEMKKIILLGYFFRYATGKLKDEKAIKILDDILDEYEFKVYCFKDYIKEMTNIIESRK